MNKLTDDREPVATDDEIPGKGPNLILIYALLAVGILVAMAFAAMIVWPFYNIAKK